jgi:hypothetical protein
MPVAVNVNLQGLNDMTAAMIKLQTFLGQPVKVSMTLHAVEREIIKLQTYLQTQGKFSAGSINRLIDDQMLPAKIIDLQVAANLP